MFKPIFSNSRLLIFLLLCVQSFSLIAQNHRYLRSTRQLINAAKSSDLEEARHLLSKKVYTEVVDNDGCTPLMIAARNNDIPMISLLLESAADVNYRAESKVFSIKASMAALDYAVLTRDTKTIDYLIERGADITPQDDPEIDKANNPLVIASKLLNQPMVEYLLKKGAKISDADRLSLVGYHIIHKDTAPKISEAKHVSLINFWRNKKPTISDEMVYIASLDYPRTSGYKVIRYLAEKMTVKGVDKLIKRYNDSIEEKEKLAQQKALEEQDVRLERIMNEALAESEQWKKIEQEQKRLEQQEKEKYPVFRTTVVPILMLVLIVFIAYYLYKGRLPNFTLFAKIGFPKQSAGQIKTGLTSFVGNVYEKVKTIKRRLYKPEKGWTVDDTIEIEVEFLTIEDMINPISLKNEYEKSVREMIALVRTLEYYTNNELEQKLGEEGLKRKLEDMWEYINPGYVRHIYKWSLYLVVKDYARRDWRVKPFLVVQLNESIHQKQSIERVI